MNKLLVFFVLSVPLFAQQQSRYLANYTASLASSASVTLTIQQPATAANQVSFEGSATGLPPGVIITCPGQSFTVAQTANGIAATATAGTITKMPGTLQPAQSTFWTASNVSGGTTIAPLLTYSSGSIGTIDWSPLRLGTGGTSANISLTVTNTGNTSCTVAVGIYLREQ